MRTRGGLRDVGVGLCALGRPSGRQDGGREIFAGPYGEPERELFGWLGLGPYRIGRWPGIVTGRGG